MIICKFLIFAVGTVAGAVVACVNAAGSYGKGYEDGYIQAWKIRDIVEKVGEKRG